MDAIQKIVAREMAKPENNHYSISDLVRMEAHAQGIKLTEKQIRDIAQRIIFGG
jgi:hypothetical protein